MPDTPARPSGKAAPKKRAAKTEATKTGATKTGATKTGAPEKPVSSPASPSVTANQQAAQSTAPNADYEKRLRSVKAFLDGPLFKDLSEQPVVVAESAAAIEERKRDLDHRIHVAKSLIALLEQDKAALDALESAQKAGKTG